MVFCVCAACEEQVEETWASYGRYYLRSSDIDLSEQLTDEVKKSPGVHTLDYRFARTPA